MGPSDLISKSKRRLKRPPQRSLSDALQGDRLPALTDQQIAGIDTAAVLASRYLAECEREHAQADEQGARLPPAGEGMRRRSDQKKRRGG